jgi:hypothetical protein
MPPTPSAWRVHGASFSTSVVVAIVAGCGSSPPLDRVVPTRAIAGPGAVRIHDIQGQAHLSPLAGQIVTAVRGIVTVRSGNGFYLQDPLPDRNPSTSEGLFVFTETPPDVQVGDEVRVTGPVVEFRPGCRGCRPGDSAFANLTTTEISLPTEVLVVSSGNPLPAPVAVGPGPGERCPPAQVIDDDSAGDVEVGPTVFDPGGDGLDFHESLEGMRVSVADAVAVGPTVDLGGNPPSREMAVLSRGGQGAGQRTGRQGIVVSPGDFNPERLILSSRLQAEGPVVDVGDRFAGEIVGVVDYSFGNFKLLVSDPLPVVVRGGLKRETLRFPDPGPDELTFASLNVENLDAGDGPEKFTALAGIVVVALRSPDLLGLEEVQDNNGPVNDAVVDASATLQKLRAAIIAAGGPSYQFRSIDPLDDQDGGEPGGNIRVVILFRSDRGLGFVDRPGAGPTTANRVLAAAGTARLEFSPGRLDPDNPAWRGSRKPLAAELSFNGQPIFLVVSHFNSKGGDQPLFGRFQPPRLRSEEQRLQQATVVARLAEDLLAIDPAARLLVMGDLNDFQFSSPLVRLGAAGLRTLVGTLPEGERYSYVFQGNSQALDHILVSPALGSAAHDVVHVNAEFAEQTSDHDPTAVRFSVR